MYTKLEISIIFKNCNTIEELYAVTSCFKYLTDNKFMVKSIFLQTISDLRFRKIVGS